MTHIATIKNTTPNYIMSRENNFKIPSHNEIFDNFYREIPRCHRSTKCMEISPGQEIDSSKIKGFLTRYLKVRLRCQSSDFEALTFEGLARKVPQQNLEDLETKILEFKDAQDMSKFTNTLNNYLFITSSLYLAYLGGNDLYFAKSEYSIQDILVRGLTALFSLLTGRHFYLVNVDPNKALKIIENRNNINQESI